MLSNSKAQQPTMQELCAKYKGPFEIWTREAHEVDFQWPATGEVQYGWSMEVGNFSGEIFVQELTIFVFVYINVIPVRKQIKT